uniref:protein GRAVITROPIC IN THE LIGHT 1-like n=1 Tax=Erigeron canadensis TaxID=72917 RepID=UPI001CB90988|nr:protein GRAVITROPIC IN THE LIGHT 1-like [Erigeron canadensis]
MEPLNQSALNPTKNLLARKFAKVLHSRNKTKFIEKGKLDKPVISIDQTKDDDEKFNKRAAAMDAFISKIFATISSVKAAYAQLQYAQSPYNAEGIQSADQIMVTELKTLSEFKQLFLKNHVDETSPETTKLLAEIQEQRNLLLMYEITTKKLDSQQKLKQSEIIFLKEKLDEANKENRLIEKRLNSSGPLSPHDQKLHFSSLSIKNFVSALQQTTKTIKGFVKFMISEMEVANWDLIAAAGSIQPDIVFKDISHTFYAFESFVCRVMFEGFNDSGFCASDDDIDLSPRSFFDKFMELKSLKAREYITWKPDSMFAKFCWYKYLKLVHPVMEFSLFGNVNQRNLVGAGKFPETTFFALFADMAKRVWLLHCLAFAFDPDKASAFQVKKGNRFTEVYMESVNEEPSNATPEVGFTVVPGFKIGKTVVQCQVYLK